MASPFVRRLGQSALGLTPRELEVAEMVRNGYSSKEIAERLHISPKAVAFHRGNLRKKLGIKSRRESLRVRLLALDQTE
jgi:DNA-binding CsgD family transcriptional regulator